MQNILFDVLHENHENMHEYEEYDIHEYDSEFNLKNRKKYSAKNKYLPRMHEE